MNKENTLNWVRGLSSFLEFDNDLESKKFIDFLEKSMYSENNIIDTTNQAGMVEFISVLRKFAPNPIFDIFHKYYRSGQDPAALQDAFSRGQVLSKIWLSQELAKIDQKDFHTIFILAGWFGQTVKYLDKSGISYSCIRNFDIDPTAWWVSDKIFNIDKIEGFTVKSSEMDINDLTTLHQNGLEFSLKNYTSGKVIVEKRFPSLIINTSAEHFKEDWYNKFVTRTTESDPLYIIQSNNLFTIKEHINCVHSLDEMLKKFPMSRLYYSGEKELYGYKRFMLIGRP